MRGMSSAGDSVYLRGITLAQFGDVMQWRRREETCRRRQTTDATKDTTRGCGTRPGAPGADAAAEAAAAAAGRSLRDGENAKPKAKHDAKPHVSITSSAAQKNTMASAAQVAPAAATAATGTLGTGTAGAHKLAELLALARAARGAAAAAVIQQALEHPAVFTFGELLASPNIAAVRAGRPAL